jgi:hypothetical protein
MKNIKISLIIVSISILAESILIGALMKSGDITLFMSDSILSSKCTEMGG